LGLTNSVMMPLSSSWIGCLTDSRHGGVQSQIGGIGITCTRTTCREDVFLTWDRAILSVADDLAKEFSISVMRPEDYLHALESER
jgi:hypothetical protein